MSAFATQNRKFSVKKLRCEKDNLNLLSKNTGKMQTAHHASPVYMSSSLGGGGGTKSVLNFFTSATNSFAGLNAGIKCSGM